jgi:hypothetical protein
MWEAYIGGLLFSLAQKKTQDLILKITKAKKTFITALLAIAKLWKQLRCPAIDEWIKKMWHIYTIKYYSTIRNNDMWFEGKWMQLEDIMLSEKIQAQKHNGHMFSLTHGR